MAKQGGVLGITGTVGGMTFDKNGNVRKAARSTKSKFATAPSMARTRENVTEFSRAATAGKLLRQGLRRQIRGAADRFMSSRLLKGMRSVMSLDTTSPRGERQIRKANLVRLVGFDFNDGAPLSTICAVTCSVRISAAGVVTVTIPALVPNADLKAPADATHYELEIGVAVVDFEAGISRAVAVTGIPAAAPLDGLAVAALAPTANLGAAPAATEAVIVVLGINFYQQTNGQLYPLNDTNCNPLGVVFVQ